MVGLVAMPYFSARSTVTTAAVAATPATVIVRSVVPSLADPETPDVLTEADLMAIDTTSIERMTAARAEWIVLEYFTLDPGDDWSDRVDVAGRIDVGDLLPMVQSLDTVSYVEWVRAVAVERVRAGAYQVTVVMRRTVALDGRTYRRLPVEEVVLHIRVGDDGLPELESTPVIVEGTPVAPGGSLETIGHLQDQIGIGWPSDQAADADN